MSTTVVNRTKDSVLGMLCESLNDIEKVRIANDNRIQILTRKEEDSDGQVRGFGIDLDDKLLEPLKNISEVLDKAEAKLIQGVQREVQKLPYYSFIKETRGLGDKQVARLLACIGDPYWHVVEDRPRSIHELWKYSGYAVHEDGKADGRRKGEKVRYNPEAKSRVYLIAVSLLKLNSDYKSLYDLEKERQLQLHEGMTKGHAHNRALRRVGKEVLKDLYNASKAVHNGEEVPAGKK